MRSTRRSFPICAATSGKLARAGLRWRRTCVWTTVLDIACFEWNGVECHAMPFNHQHHHHDHHNHHSRHHHYQRRDKHFYHDGDMHMKRMPTCPNVRACWRSISDATLRLQKIWGTVFLASDKTVGNARADTKPGDAPTITVVACAAQQHTIPHESLRKQIEKSWTNECDTQEHVWLGCGSRHSTQIWC